MFRPEGSKTANFRADYAKHADFCEVFQRDMKPLYLLAFLLTANHKQTERCFASTLEEGFKEQTVFKEWARSWVKRSLIENAIEILTIRQNRRGTLRTRGVPETRSCVDYCRHPSRRPAGRWAVKLYMQALQTLSAWTAFLESPLASCWEAQSSDG